MTDEEVDLAGTTRPSEPMTATPGPLPARPETTTTTITVGDVRWGRS